MLRILLAVLSISLISFPIQAQPITTIEKHIVVSPPPTASCSTIAGHWEGGIWIATHEVCKYENRPEGVTWINDYWSCTAASTDGTCTTWVFVPGRWEAATE